MTTHAAPLVDDHDPCIPRPIDAMQEAVARVNVVLRMLNEHECPHDPDTQDTPEDEDGYDLTIAREALRGVRDMLLAAIRKHESEKGARHGA